MPRIVVVGAAGAMGRIIAADLRRFGRGADLVLADRAAGRGIVATDVLDRRRLAGTLRGADVVIASIPYRLNLAAMEGALAAGAHYVDLGGLFHMTRRQLRLHARFRRAGRMALLGMGSAPGIVNLLAVHAARGLRRVRAVHCMVGSTGDGGFGYSPDTLLDEFSLPSAVFRDGRVRTVPPLDPAERRLERFPRPVGRIALDTTLHSEIATLPRFFRRRGVREVTFRQGFDAVFADRVSFLVRLGLADGSKRAALLEGLARLPKPPPAPRHEILRARVVGGSRARVVDCVAGPEAGFGVGPDIDTGAPASIAALWIASGRLPVRPGVFAPEEVIPPAPFFRELERRGMRVST